MALSPLPATTSITNWNRATKHVEAAIRSGRYISAETALVFAGPPRLTDIGGIDANLNPNTQDGVILNAGANALYPIGLLEQFGVQQMQNVQKMFEIGSRRSYQQSGRVQVGGSIGRVMFNGASMLRVAYAYYPSAVQQANGQILTAGGDSVSAAVVGANASNDGADTIYPPIYFAPGAFAGQDPEENQPHSFWINLMSEIFSFPFGMGIILRDNRNVNYGAFYMEDCFITTHSFQVSSTSTLITEAMSFQCDACVPMEFDTNVGALIAPLGG
jgi:hypothetical protein